ncbi:MAG: N-acetyltransferase [Pseudolabrys sp.]
MITLRQERPTDIPAREALLDQAMGKIRRRRKTSERLRAGRLPADGLALVAVDGARLIGTVRLWDITIESGEKALLLGPMAVVAGHRGHGIGGALMRHAVATAFKLGHGCVILVGDAPYYGRFGFSAAKTTSLRMPGPFERDRLLALELGAGALDSARGMIGAAGKPVQNPQRRAA